MEFSQFYQELSVWIDTHLNLFQMIDAVLFLIFFLVVCYLFTFVVASFKKKATSYPRALRKQKFVVFFTVYKDQDSIFESIESFSDQDYSCEDYRLVVIAENCSDAYEKTLLKQGVELVQIRSEEPSLLYAYQQAVVYLEKMRKPVDIVLILNAGNTIDNDMLDRINDAVYSGCDAIQTHSVAKFRNTSTEVIEAVSEEVNNTIFRKGHTVLGFSSALIGSGMAFDFTLFKDMIFTIEDLGIEKQLEGVLLKQNIYIEYLESVYTYDRKTNDQSGYYNKRRSWFASQFSNLIQAAFSLPKAIFSGKIDYCNKILQWSQPPRLLLFGFILLISFFLLIFDWTMAIKWILLFFLLCLTFFLAIPNYLIDKHFTKAVLSLPKLFLLALLGIFKIRGIRKDYVK